MAMIKEKLKGHKPIIAAEPERGNVVNLMDALKKSVQEARPEKARKGMATAGLKKAPGAKRKKEAHA
jgi:DNA end-binding protein Ku